MSKVIKNGTIVTADRTWKADVLIEDGKIVGIGAGPSWRRELDATGCYIMPGGIDPHTHLEMPFMGTYSSDDFESGTRAALSGGTTMVVDFCLPSPGQSLLEALQMWHNKTSKACADYSFHMAITWWGEQVFNEMETIVDKGINTFKHFMAYKGALMVDDDEMYASFKRCAELGALPLVHAENGDVVAQLQQKLMAEGNNGPEAHAYSRPPEVEGEATNRAIMIADMAGCPLYIVHTSCEQAHEAIRRARQKGMRVFGEPLIQHLTLDETEYFNKDWDHAARRVMSPPFRNKLHQDSLWAGLQAGSLQVVATDHCAFTTEQKRSGIGDFTKIPNGTGGLEDRMPMLWTKGRQHRPADHERIRRRHFDQYRQNTQHLPEKRRDHRRRGRRYRGLGPEAQEDDHRRQAAVSDRLQRLRRQGGDRSAAFRVLPRRTDDSGIGHHGEAWPWRIRLTRATPAVNRALSKWKEITAPRKVERTGIPATGV